MLRPSLVTPPAGALPMTPKKVVVPTSVPMVRVLLFRLTKEFVPIPAVFALARDWMAWFAFRFRIDGAKLPGGTMTAGAPGKFASVSGSMMTSVRIAAMPPSAGSEGSAPSTLAFSVPPLPIHVGPA